MSATSQPEVLSLCFQEGADEVFTKPVTKENLQQLLQLPSKRSMGSSDDQVRLSAEIRFCIFIIILQHRLVALHFESPSYVTHPLHHFF